MSLDLSLSEMNAIERRIVCWEKLVAPVAGIVLTNREARALFDAASALPDALATIEDLKREIKEVRAELAAESGKIRSFQSAINELIG